MTGQRFTTPQPKIPTRVTLFRYFKDRAIPLEEVAQTTGYRLNYLKNLRSGSDKLTAAARFKFSLHYPETQAFLMRPEEEDD